MSHTQPGSGLQSLNSAPGMSGGACSAQSWVQDIALESAGGSQCHPLMELRLWWFRSDCSFSPSFRKGGEGERKGRRTIQIIFPLSADSVVNAHLALY